MTTITCARGAIEGGALDIHTEGLRAADHAELSMVRVPELLAPVAERYLSELANYATNVKPLAAGETIGVPTHFGANFARLVEDGDALRVLDVMEGAPADGPPSLVLATEVFEEAFRRYQRGELQLAAQLLETSLDVYPGEPGAPDLGRNFNTENHRAHLLLFTITQDPQHLDRALARSIHLQLEQLGGPMEMLGTILGDRERVETHAELTLKIRLATWDRVVETDPEGLNAPVAPLPQPHLHTDPEGALLTALSVVPTEYADAFWSGPGRAAIEGEDALALTVDVLTAHKDRLAELVVRTGEAGVIWGATELERGPLPPPIDRSTGVEPLITAVLAQIGALAWIGLGADRRRAWFGLDGEPTEDERQMVQTFVSAREGELVEIIRASQQQGPPS